MAHPNTGIVSKKIGEANADLSKKETAIGSGPFKLAEWVPDNYMRFEANKDYYVSGQPYLDGVRMNVIPDETGITAALRTKAADMGIIFDAKVARTLRSETGVTLSAKPSLSYNLLFVNTKRKPFDNIKVRQAIAYAIDRKAIIDAVAFGEGEMTGPIAPALANYALPTSQYPLYTRDVAKAKQLLQEAGVGPVSFTMLTQTTEPVYAKDIAQLVQAQLAEIGVTMKIETLEFTQWVDRWLKADFDMAPGLNGGGPDPDVARGLAAHVPIYPAHSRRRDRGAARHVDRAPSRAAREPSRLLRSRPAVAAPVLELALLAAPRRRGLFDPHRQAGPSRDRAAAS